MNPPCKGNAPHATRRTTVAELVALLLSRLHPEVALERRRDKRFPLPVVMRLVPLDDDQLRIDHAAIAVVGKNISRRGISFFHEQPLSHRRVILELSDNELGNFTAEVDVTWCRFTKPGWYESGGRLTRLSQWNKRADLQNPDAVILSQAPDSLTKHCDSFAAPDHGVVAVLPAL